MKRSWTFSTELDKFDPGLAEAKDKTAGTDAPQESGQFTGEWCQFRRAFHLLAILPRNWRMASSDEMSSKDSHFGWLFGDTIGETDQEGTFSELVLTVSNKNVTPDPGQTQFRPGHSPRNWPFSAGTGGPFSRELATLRGAQCSGRQ